ncbi:MAG: hypothetical protein ACQEXJ_11170 [Myxococcota bacterium]
MRRLSNSLILAALALGACSDAADGGGMASMDAGRQDTAVPGDSGDPAEDSVDTAGLTCSTHAQCAAAADVGPCGVPRCVNGECVARPRTDRIPCDDGDACTVDTVCVDGACAGGRTLECADDDPCTADTCDPATGCEHTVAPEDLACDDGDPCTTGDRCTEGTCAGEPDPECACEADDDCTAFQDADACNGTLACIAGRCAIAPGSTVTCPDPGTCRVAACVPGTGECKTLLAPEGTPCTDGNPCTSGDTCSEGVCAGTPGACPCDEDTDCVGFQREDYDLCQGPLVCLDGVCAPDPEQRVTCQDEPEGACLTTACESSTGLCATVARADGSDCGAPGDGCEAPGTCQKGQCVATGPPCDDGNPCTDDLCTVSGCHHLPTVGPCDDGDPCTQGEACAAGTCGGGKPLSCDDLNPCTVDACDPEAGGCAHVPVADGATCGAGDACVGDGVCQDGVCVDLAPVTCPEPGPCATATCLPGEGCVDKAAPDGTPCDDGDPCTSGGTCEAGACASMPRACNDDNPCTVDTCDPDSGGCVHTPTEDGIACQSADPCLEGATCQGGACTGGEPVTCEDTSCATRGCDPITGACVVVEDAEDATPCGGDDPCTAVGTCSDGACVGATPVDCDDGDACTVDACDPVDGSCEHAPLDCIPPGGDACVEAACDPAAGCVDVTSPACEGEEVLWSSSIPCDGGAWSFESSGDGAGFVIDDAAAPSGPWDGDCSLHLALPGSAGDAWSADARAPLPNLSQVGGITVRFVEWWSGADEGVGGSRSVGLLSPEGEVLAMGVVATAAESGTGWTERQVTLAADAASYGATLVFRMEAHPPTVEAAWYVDRVVVTAGTAP